MLKTILVLWALFFVASTGFSQENEVERVVLPKPSGRFQVGRSWTTLTDSSRQNRQIPLFIYCPVKTGAGAHFIIPTKEWRETYVPVLQKKLGQQAGEAVAYGKAIFSEDVTVARAAKFPLVLFSPGLGWSTLEYCFIIQELVSAGYIVLAINSSPLAPVLQTPEGRFLADDNPVDKYQLAADDIAITLRQLKAGKGPFYNVSKHIDFAKIAVSGHSLGGAAAMLASTDKLVDIKAAVNMDGDMMDGSSKAAPSGSVLFLNQIPAGFETLSFDQMKKDADRGWRYQKMTSTASNSPNGKYISIAGLYHSNFQDYALLPNNLIPDNIRKIRLGPIDGNKGLQLISQTLITYLNEELKDKIADWRKIEKVHPIVRVIDLAP